MKFRIVVAIPACVYVTWAPSSIAAFETQASAAAARCAFRSLAHLSIAEKSGTAPPSLPDYTLLPKLTKLRIPALVVSGDHEFISAPTAEHTQALPNARMLMLRDCGHSSYLESPVALREHIDAFFREGAKSARLPPGSKAGLTS
ncbi:MAG TPA: alpha/beta hydrolase [Terriglobales bacterium]|nr:alpha/beta hydrolase [Terriglobales bacterium]